MPPAAVFIGKRKNTSAARCALKINHAVVKIINPAIKGTIMVRSPKVATPHRSV